MSIKDVKIEVDESATTVELLSPTVSTTTTAGPPSDEPPRRTSGSGAGDVSSSDIGNLVGDGSFSDADDSNGWMQKIDVTGFKQLQLATTHEERPSPHHFVVTSAQSRSDSSPMVVVVPAPQRRQLPVMSYPSPSSLPDYGSNLSLSSPPAKRIRPSTADSKDSTMGSCFYTDYHVPEGVSMVIDVQTQATAPTREEQQPSLPKPTYSYSCLIALALKNSKSGRLTVSEIYNFMCENFPYFRSAPAGWKNSVRHNLSLNKCFEKIEIESPAGQGRKACLWTMNPNRVHKMEQEIFKWREKDPNGVRDAMANPADLPLIENGLKGMPGGDASPYGAPPPPLFCKLPDLVQHAQQQRLLDAISSHRQQLSSSSAAPASSYFKPVAFGQRSTTAPESCTGAPVGAGPGGAQARNWRSFSLTSAAVPDDGPYGPPLQHQAGPSGYLPHTPTKGESQQTMMLSPMSASKLAVSPASAAHGRFSTPFSGGVSAAQLMSPYSHAHTPPQYSPPSHMMHSPHMVAAGSRPPPPPYRHQQAGLPLSAEQGSPGSAYAGAAVTYGGSSSHFSPYGGYGAGAYESAVNATNINNSLLQTALSQSPCRAPPSISSTL